MVLSSAGSFCLLFSFYCLHTGKCNICRGFTLWPVWGSQRCSLRWSLNGITASGAAVGGSQRPYNHHKPLTSKAGLSLQYSSSFVGSAVLLPGAGMMIGTSAACLQSFLDPWWLHTAAACFQPWLRSPLTDHLCPGCI